MPHEPSPLMGSRRAMWAFVCGTALASGGGALALICATGVTTAAGGRTSGALYTGIYLAIDLAAGALAIPYAPKIAHRLGTRRAFAVLLGCAAVGHALTGLLLILGAPGLPVVLAFGPFLAAATTMSSSLAPLVYRASLAASDTATAVVRMSVVKGLAWGLGSLAGGIALSSWGAIGMGVGLLIAGLLKFPIVLVLASSRPRQPIAPQSRTASSWRAMRSALSQSRTVLAAALLAVGTGLFVSPVLLMAVPLAQALSPGVRYQAAGILMASFAIGQVLSPVVVAVLRRGRSPASSAARACVGTGIALVVSGLVAAGTSQLWPQMRQHLLTMAVIAVLLGVVTAGFTFATQALLAGAAAEAAGPEAAAMNLAAVRLCGTAAAPAGVLAWSILLGTDGASPALLIGGLATTAIAMLARRLARQDGAAAPHSITP